ncbi:uncharacterized protein [Ptychodera flava]|uniref:uncharacterized protein n=1 Tax=Ptychodera flava TaxID=63121 RepID=UPI003969C60B
MGWGPSTAFRTMASTMDNIRTMRVPELRDFLASRGITCNNARKDKLVQLVELAIELDIRPIEPDDREISSKRRRTVVDARNRPITLPDPAQIRNWDSNLCSLPPIVITDVMIYLWDVCQWTRERMAQYRKDNGHLLFADGHIIDVKLHRVPNSDYMYVMSECVRETSQREKPYRTWFLLKTNSEIISGGCNCVAEHGTCKHCVALLFSLHDFDGRHKDRSTEVATDVTCKWDKPRKVSTPMDIDDIDMRKDKSKPAKPRPIMSAYYPGAIRDEEADKRLTEFIRQGIYKAAPKGSCWNIALGPPSRSDEDENPKTIIELGQSYNSQSDGDFISYIKGAITTQDADKVALMTCEQRDSEDWFKYRQGRITASIAHDIAHMRETSDDNNYIVRKIMDGKPLEIQSAHVQFGVKNEPVAKHLYCQKTKKAHKKFKFEDVGLMISMDKPYLASSPDGRVSCACCGVGLCEISVQVNIAM